MGETCEFCGTGNFAHKRLVCGAQVARLEGELAGVQTKYDRLLFTHDEVTLPMLYEADERLKVLGAAIRAKDAALGDMVAIAAERLVQFPADGYFRQLYDIGGAALSPDAGKGGLEVREQAAAALADAVNTAHSSFLDRHAYPRTQHSGSLRECPTDLCKKWCAALDALKGVE